MSVQPVQAHTHDPAVAGRWHSAGQAIPAPAGSSREAGSTQQDAVTVSEQARQLAAGQAEAHAPAADGSRLQLDFRQLRDLAFKAQAKNQAAKAEG